MTGAALGVIVPASNESRLIPACLAALARSDEPGRPVEVVVVSNGSTDGTAAAAEAARGAIEARGWRLRVLDLPAASKPAALDAGDGAATAPLRAYLDADVEVSPPLLAAVARAIDRPEPAYASGRPAIAGRGLAARLYARAWARVPFMREGVPGCGLFAVNAAGRARWGAWPAIIADDLFARLQFAPHERHLAPHPYRWPVAEGFSALVRVRDRQDRGAREVAARFPRLAAHEDKARLGIGGTARLAARDPLAFGAYAGVALAVRLRRGEAGWTRGR